MEYFSGNSFPLEDDIWSRLNFWEHISHKKKFSSYTTHIGVMVYDTTRPFTLQFPTAQTSSARSHDHRSKLSQGKVIHLGRWKQQAGKMARDRWIASSYDNLNMAGTKRLWADQTAKVKRSWRNHFVLLHTMKEGSHRVDANTSFWDLKAFQMSTAVCQVNWLKIR